MSTPEDPRPQIDTPPEPDPVSPAAPAAPAPIPPVVVPTQAPTPASNPDFLDTLDRTLDPEAADRRTLERFKNPFIRWIIIFLMALLGGIFVIYTAAFIFRIPIPEPEVLKVFINAVVTVMQMFVP